MESVFALCGLGPVCLYGIVGLVVAGLFIKVLVDRLNNKEDDYYSKNVKQ
jgi:hypothetical protein